MKSRLLICLFLLLSFKGFSQSCTLNVTLSQSAPAICSGSNVILTATAAGGTGPYTFAWNTGEITSSITVNKAGTYTVSVSAKTPGCQPVISSIAITVSATPLAPTAANKIVCSGSSATLTATAPGGNYQWYDQAAGGNFLQSGATYTTSPITADTVFYVETTVGGCTSARTAVFVTLSGNPGVAGQTVCSGNAAILSVSGGTNQTWYNAPGGSIVGSGAIFTTPVLTATTTYYVVEVTASGCTTGFIPVTARVTPPPLPPTAGSMAVCAGSSANLHASAPAGVINWYNVPVGGTSLISSPDYTTPPLTATTTYYVETQLNNCVSLRTPVTVTVNPIPQAPAPQSYPICYGTSTTLTEPPLAAGTYQWYSAAVGGILLTTGLTYNTPVLIGSTTYYVEASNGQCSSLRSPVNVTVNPQLPAPSVAGGLICPGSAVTLTATGPGGVYSWYNAPVGGTLLGTGASYTTVPLNANTTFYVETAIGGCTSPRTAVTVSMLPATTAPVASNTTICSGNSATLIATAASNNFAWYDGAGNLLSSGQVYATPALTTTTTYYVETTANGCTSSRTPVTVTVTPLPSSPTASGVSICSGTTASLTATAASGTVQWYSAPAGGNLLQTGNSYATPVLSANTTYYVQSTNGLCNSTSARVPVTVSIIVVASPQFQYPSGTFCVTSPNPAPVINNPSGGTFSSLPAGLVFVSTTTGQINISASTPGTYTVSFAGNGPCAGISGAQIAITASPNAAFSYSGPYCQGGANPLPTFPAGGSGGVFTASPAGLVFLNTTTGQIDLSASHAGAYTVTNTISASGTCAPSVTTATVTIDPVVIVSAGPPQTVSAGSMVQMAGSITGGTTTGAWSGGTGTFSNANLPNAIYTPGAGETLAALTLTSSNPPGPCGQKSASVTITIVPNPAPTAMGISVCSGNSAALSAIAPGGPYQWYSAAAGGAPLATGPTFTTPPLTVTTTYYVQTTNGGITSSRTAVTVTVTAPPVQPTAPGQPICMGGSATLTASGSAGTYQWYDAAVGGNLLSQNGTYSTPALTTNTSYFVQAALNGCASPRTQVDVTVNAAPNVTSPASGTACSGNALNYPITADVATATFSWSRAQIAGISNLGVLNQTSPTITETLTNTTNNAINVTYIIIPAAGSCSGPPFNYVVTVYPSAIVTSPAVIAPICNMTPVNYAVTFNTPVTNFSWSRAAVPGIGNAAVTGQAAGVIQEVLFNTTNAPIDVTYVFNYSLSTCAGPPFSLVVTLNPSTAINSPSSGLACSGFPQNYVITANVPGTTFNWSRAVQKNVSNPGVFGQTSGTISETLINTGPVVVNVIYAITPTANGCPGPRFNYTAKLNPPIPIPVANNNSPVCIGSTIQLRTNPILNATYAWSGPGAFTSALQNPNIANVTAANSGTYSLVVTVNGCSTLPVTTQVMVDQLPLANAGHDTAVCIAASSIQLSGNVTGGTTTGIWTTAGTGTFLPASNILKGQYIPTAADRAAGSVVLTLTSTSKDNCMVSTSSMTIKFTTLPAVVAGHNQDVCSQAASVKLNGTLLIPGNVQWTTSGSGYFSPSGNLLGANYIPGAADVKNGSVTLKLSIIGAGICYIPSDSLTVNFIPPPTVYAGGTKYVLKGNTLTLTPVVSSNNVHYLWSPNIDINNDTLKNPVITGTISRIYTLTVTDSRGCVNQDSTFIKVSPPIIINNTFTPNGDGINDYWDVSGLIAYVDATVDIFDRYGQKIFHSLGYPKAWDGTYNGKPCPVGVYYYVINTNFSGQVLSGYITIIR
jgi:gliding motility-associated-like protein